MRTFRLEVNLLLPIQVIDGTHKIESAQLLTLIPEPQLVE
jgi:hypothetical protein